AVAHRKEGAGNVHRHIQSGTRNELLVVEIARMRTRRSTGDAAHERIRSDADGTEKRSEFQTNARREIRKSGARIETYEFNADVWKFVGKRAAVGHETGDAVRMKKLKT